MPAATEQKMPLLGRCKRCDYAMFVADDSTAVEARDFNEVKGDGKVYRVGNEGFFARCPNRHAFFKLRRVEGTYSEVHQCDARCLNAKGWKCTCSCGGMNHGKGFAVTNIVANAPAHEDRSIAQAAVEATRPADEPATDRQINFLMDLLDGSRVIPGHDTAEGYVTGEDRRKLALRKLANGEFTKRQASKTIEWLLSLPRTEEN